LDYGKILLPQLPVPLVLVITSIFFIVIGGRVIPATATATSAVEPEQRGSFMAFNASVQQLGSGFAAFIAGAIVIKMIVMDFMNTLIMWVMLRLL
jgi:MFS transporter, DHA1 family, inner membrane transport protein